MAFVESSITTISTKEFVVTARIESNRAADADAAARTCRASLNYARLLNQILSARIMSTADHVWSWKFDVPMFPSGAALRHE